VEIGEAVSVPTGDVVDEATVAGAIEGDAEGGMVGSACGVAVGDDVTKSFIF